MLTSKSTAGAAVSSALRAVLGLVLAAAVLLGGFGLLLHSRIDALRRGSAFHFDYTVTSTSAQPSATWSLLEALGATTGTLSGQNSGSDLTLSWYAPGKEEPYTQLVLADGQVYLDVRQIYRTFLSGLHAQYPAIASLIPDWGLGDYITGSQMATLLGQEPAMNGLEQYQSGAFALAALEPAHPDQGLDGYFYFTLKEPLGGIGITVGFPPSSLWSALWGVFFRCHVLVDIPSQGLRLELTGKALPGEYAIQTPASVMRDEDIAALAELIQTVRSIADFVKQLVQ